MKTWKSSLCKEWITCILIKITVFGNGQRNDKSNCIVLFFLPYPISEFSTNWQDYTLPATGKRPKPQDTTWATSAPPARLKRKKRPPKLCYICLMWCLVSAFIAITGSCWHFAVYGVVCLQNYLITLYFRDLSRLSQNRKIVKTIYDAIIQKIQKIIIKYSISTKPKCDHPKIAKSKCRKNIM